MTTSEYKHASPRTCTHYDLTALTHDLVIRTESDPVTDSDPFIDELDVTIRVISNRRSTDH
jgi:hypothetical protein